MRRSQSIVIVVLEKAIIVLSVKLKKLEKGMLIKRLKFITLRRNQWSGFKN